MNYLTPEQALFMHYRLIEETGGSHGLRDIGLLQSAIARPMAAFGGDDLYPDIFTKAAALMHSLIKNHRFIDGNKRTAITSSSIFLLRNGFQITASNKELQQFTFEAASTKIEIEKIARWFKKQSVKTA
ncbi:MAG: type II toxin-antitoxin system death-on-curing family toxin [Nitrospirota bacterium]